MTQIVTDAELQAAYKQMARIIARHGEKYLPIFERLEEELNRRRARAESLKRAIETAEPHLKPPPK